jgi:hypothetical protein
MGKSMEQSKPFYPFESNHSDSSILDLPQFQTTAKNSLTVQAGGRILGMPSRIIYATSSVRPSICIACSNSDDFCAADDDDADEDLEVDSDPVALEFDDNSYPLLPLREDLSLEQMKQYIRRYVTVIYCEYSFFGQNSF